MLNYFGWLLVVLGGWKEKNQKKSDLNQINLIFLIFLKNKKKKNIANPVEKVDSHHVPAIKFIVKKQLV